ncbi:MAG TPA: SDR family oxidoreductase [Phycisphaerales bacterium]|nr:SDR family oxidoreductase [Phycisphaerales bacterium]
MGGLNGRIAVVTGASAGIGAAIVELLAREGAKVIANARRREKLHDLVARLGPSVRAFPGDASDPAVITAMLDDAERAFGPPDLVIANAGRGLNGSVLTSDVSQWEEMIRVNVLGAAHLMREAGRRVAAATAGKSGPDVVTRPRDLIVLGSVVGRHVSPFSSMYGGTKFNVHGMVEGVRRELGPKGVRVTLIEPGFVVSEFQGVAGYDPKWFDEVVQRIGPVLQPEDVARCVTFIASQPPHVHVSDILVRPTRQDYP